MMQRPPQNRAVSVLNDRLAINPSFPPLLSETHSCLWSQKDPPSPPFVFVRVAEAMPRDDPPPVTTLANTWKRCVGKTVFDIGIYFIDKYVFSVDIHTSKIFVSQKLVFKTSRRNMPEWHKSEFCIECN